MADGPVARGGAGAGGRFDPLGLKPRDPEALRVMQTKELNNGRLAMVAIAGFVAQELVNGTEIFQHLFRYIENESFLELDALERVFDLPITPIPEIVLQVRQRRRRSTAVGKIRGLLSTRLRDPRSLPACYCGRLPHTLPPAAGWVLIFRLRR